MGKIRLIGILGGYTCNHCINYS